MDWEEKIVYGSTPIYICFSIYGIISVIISNNLASTNPYDLWSFCLVTSILMLIANFGWAQHIGDLMVATYILMCSIALSIWGSVILSEITGNSDADILYKDNGSSNYNLYVCFFILYVIQLIMLTISIIISITSWISEECGFGCSCCRDCFGQTRRCYSYYIIDKCSACGHNLRNYRCKNNCHPKLPSCTNNCSCLCNCCGFGCNCGRLVGNQIQPPILTMQPTPTTQPPSYDQIVVRPPVYNPNDTQSASVTLVVLRDANVVS